MMPINRLLAVITAGIAPACAQVPQPNNDVLAALLSEVRQLRVAIERSTLMNTRAQVLLQRLQVQESKTLQLKQESERASNEATGMRGEQARLADVMRRHEAELARSETPAARKEVLQRELEGTRQRALEMSTAETQFRAKESALASEYRAEQTRLAELQQRLNEIDAAIEKALR